MSSIITSVSLDEDTERKLNVLTVSLLAHQFRNKSEVVREAIRRMYAEESRRKAKASRKANPRGSTK